MTKPFSTKRKIAFIHASPAAIGPLMQFYSKEAPELEITNLLDDGIIRLFATKNMEATKKRLREMIETACTFYGVEVAMLTCSAAPRRMLEELRGKVDLPLLKIDEPMARAAVRAGQRIGVVVTFPPTLEITNNLLKDAAAEAGLTIEIMKRIVPKAHHALLAGNNATHNELLITGIKQLAEEPVDAILLAQVSMAQIMPQLEGQISIPVFNSLHTSLPAIRSLLRNRRKNYC